MIETVQWFCKLTKTEKKKCINNNSKTTKNQLNREIFSFDFSVRSVFVNVDGQSQSGAHKITETTPTPRISIPNWESVHDLLNS